MSGQGVISSNDLMKKLVSAKKVMDKVETGNFERGNINENVLLSDPDEVVKSDIKPSNKRPVGAPNINLINQSKLPDAIKKAMIESPIPQISLNDKIDMDMFEGAKKLMEREGMISKQSKNKTTNTSSVSVSSEFVNTLTPIIENIIRKTLDEIVDKKLNQILTAQQTASINENLVLKVGDSIFKGKITGVNKSK